MKDKLNDDLHSILVGQKENHIKADKFEIIRFSSTRYLWPGSCPVEGIEIKDNKYIHISSLYKQWHELQSP